jgi:hypothetical protein
MQYGAHGSDGDEPVFSLFNFEPHSSIVSNSNRGSSEHHVVGGPWSLYSVHDALSTNIVLGSACEFCRDAIFLLQVDKEGAFKGSAFIMSRDCNP